jgi:cyclopropane fatty-acyl-phospholipid synthase-like methyltransferase
MKWIYNLIYRYFKAPWDVGARKELVELVEEGRIKPGRAIDLGSGAGDNAVWLAEQGFDVTGVDFSEAAVQEARSRASEAGVEVDFIIDDLTDLQHVSGPFDFLLDYGVLDDLRPQARQDYARNVQRLARPGSQYLLWGWEYPARWWEKLLSFWGSPFQPGEIEELFGHQFDIERIAGRIDFSQRPPGYAAYLMTKN